MPRRLDDRQQAAVDHRGGPLLILAGPGSGKTAVLCARIDKLIDRGADPERMLAMTFSANARKEMTQRLEPMLEGDMPEVQTFHSLAMKMLRTNPEAANLPDDWELADRKKSLKFVKQAVESLHLDPGKWSPVDEAKKIGVRKNLEQDPKNPTAGGGRPPDWKERKSLQIHNRYNDLLEEAGMLDFDDMLLKAVGMMEDPEQRELWAGRWDHILIDECQDTNIPQFKMLHALGEGHREITAVGDPDQTIYEFRGAVQENINRFRNDFQADVIELQKNYRSTETIVKACRQIMEEGAAAETKGRIAGRGLESAAGTAGEPVKHVKHENEAGEAAWIQNMAADAQNEYAETAERKEVAILYRTNAQSRAVEENLKRSGIVYTVSGGTPFYDRKEIKDAAAFLEVIEDPSNDAALERIINRPPRGLGDEAQKAIARADLAPPGGRGAGAPAAGDMFSDDFIDGMQQERDDRPCLYDRMRTACGEAPGSEATLKPQQADGAKRLIKAVEDARDAAEGGAGPAEVLRKVLIETGYVSYLHASSKREDADRLENLHQLVESALEYEDGDPGEFQDIGDGGEPVEPETPLRGFLEKMHRMAEHEPELEKAAVVHLKTLHAAKGQEFHTVIIAGAEEGLSPLQARDDDHRPGAQQLQEERRLFYVGASRAEENLYVSTCAERSRFGEVQRCTPSRYVNDISKDLKREIDMPLQPINMDVDRTQHPLESEDREEGRGRGDDAPGLATATIDLGSLFDAPAPAAGPDLRAAPEPEPEPAGFDPDEFEEDDAPYDEPGNRGGDADPPHAGRNTAQSGKQPEGPAPRAAGGPTTEGRGGQMAENTAPTETPGKTAAAPAAAVEPPTAAPRAAETPAGGKATVTVKPPPPPGGHAPSDAADAKKAKPRSRLGRIIDKLPGRGGNGAADKAAKDGKPEPAAKKAAKPAKTAAKPKSRAAAPAAKTPAAPAAAGGSAKKAEPAKTAPAAADRPAAARTPAPAGGTAKPEPAARRRSAGRAAPPADRAAGGKDGRTAVVRGKGQPTGGRAAPSTGLRRKAPQWHPGG